MKQPIKEIQAYLDYGDGAIRDSDDLISYKISCDSGLCKTAMRKLEAKYLGDHNLLGKWVRAVYGVRLPSGTFEYLDYGYFLVTELTVTKDTETTSIVAYDKMVNAMTPYDKTKLNIEYPISLIDYTRVLCDSCDLELGNTSFDIMNDWQITQELWENIEGITYRDIFVQIAQATGTTCIISPDVTGDKVYFKSLTNTGESLTYDNMFKLKLENIYGAINSVVLSRTPSEDNIFLQDEASVQANGLTEFKIENNEIIDKDRENAITPIFNELNGISYYPFEATTEGLGWYEIADNIDIVNGVGDVGEVFKTSLFNFTITVDGSIKETLKASAETKTQTQYQYASSISKRIKNTELLVNKQEGYIEGLVKDIEGVNEKYAQIKVDLENITHTVQTSGGYNLIKNSVMLGYDSDNKPYNWVVRGGGEIKMHTDTESLAYGCQSGHSFTVTDEKIIRQTIYVNGDGKTPYSFSVRVKKRSGPSLTIAIGNKDLSVKHEITLTSNDDVYYAEYVVEGLTSNESEMVVVFTCVENGSGQPITITDCMFSQGEKKRLWSQAAGELMNTQVNINIDGITVKSTKYAGDYTVMSPIEFAGWSNVSGTPTKVFCLNRDVTEVEKLKAKSEVTMSPIKIVPITSGDKQGWAFVPVVEV